MEQHPFSDFVHSLAVACSAMNTLSGESFLKKVQPLVHKQDGDYRTWLEDMERYLRIVHVTEEDKCQAVCSSFSCSWSQLGTRCRRESQWQTEGFGPSVTHGWAAKPECERSAAMVRRTLGQYVAVCPRLQLTSHTQPTSTLSNKVWGVYFYKEVCSFVHWRSSLKLCLNISIKNPFPSL